MNLLNIYKKTITTIFSNPTVVLSFILYMIISSLLSGYALSAKSQINTLALLFCMILFALCFASGWFEIIKENTKETKEDKNYWGIFLEGIGKNIIPLTLGLFIYALLFILVISVTAKIAHNAFGSLNFITKDVLINTQSNQALIEYFNSLSDNQKYILSAWQLSYIFSILTYNFLILFYYPAIIFNEKANLFLKPFVALKEAFLFLFKNFFGALLIHISIIVIYMLLSFVNVKAGTNIFISTLLLFCYIYFISSALMLIFNYYEQRNNCTNRCNCIRENQDIDKSCQED